MIIRMYPKSLGDGTSSSGTRRGMAQRQRHSPRSQTYGESLPHGWLDEINTF